MTFSRDPEDYQPDPGSHFLQRKRRRDVPGEAIRACIEHGEPTEQDNGRVQLTAEWLNWDFTLVIDPVNNYAITCWPEDDAWHKDHTQR